MAPTTKSIATNEPSRPTSPFSINTVERIDLLVCPTDFKMPISRRRSSIASATALAIIMRPATIANEASVVSIMIRLLSTLFTSVSISTTLRMKAAGTAAFKCFFRAGTWLGSTLSEKTSRVWDPPSWFAREVSANIEAKFGLPWGEVLS